MNDLESTIDKGKSLGKLALYFGCWDRVGHRLHDAAGRTVWEDRRPPDLYWSEALMDGGLLRNGHHPDVVDGRVWWTCGGAAAFWYAFFWWDRSVDPRGACNSGFYVRGFGWAEAPAAFDYACSVFPQIVRRQKYPLVLQVETR